MQKQTSFNVCRMLLANEAETGVNRETVLNVYRRQLLKLPPAFFVATGNGYDPGNDEDSSQHLSILDRRET